jgi:serine/threonine-protein kinase
MTPERWRQLEEVFHAVAECAPGERPALLDRACAGDPQLRREVESLLAQEGHPFIATLISEATESLAATQRHDLIGERIGAYRVISLIGEGGMGTVFRAVRDDDQYLKQVAIKLVKPGMDTAFVLNRFRYERQILANLEHPYIARLLEGGTTEDGLPYFVMEYVEGRPITRYSAEAKLSLPQRLTLFRAVCEAVAYAHQNLVIHRDLKPSNILVTPEGVPKLLDFGIAKLLAPELLSETTERTLTAMRLMTPDYASPEQVRGEPVTTATDVYSLGVVLYELLTGRRPYQFENFSASEIERVICQTEPEKPSAVAHGAAAKLRWQLAGDLDNIVLMALRKEPERRYRSVEQFSEDIRRHLAGLPVLAREDRLGYRISKFVQRHKVGVSFAVALLVLLVAFAITMAIQATRIARERDRANQKAATAEEVTRSLVGLFEIADPSEAKGSVITTREILDKGAERIVRELHDQPEVQARLMDTIGRLYGNLGLYDKAATLLEQALEIRQRTLGQEHLEVAESLTNLGVVLKDKGDLEAAEPMLRRALAIRQKLLGEAHLAVALSLNDLGLVLRDKGKPDEAEQLHREALAMRRKLGGEEHPDVAQSLNNLALVLRDKGQGDEAEPLYRKALALRRKLFGEEHPDVAISLNNLAGLLFGRGRYDEAEQLFRDALAVRRKISSRANLFRCFDFKMSIQ